MVVIDHMASAMPLLAGGYELSSSACDSGIIGPATAPCSTRKAISISRLGASPHSSEASTNNSTEVMNKRTWPKRWVSQPVSGTAMALATANEVITQVPCGGGHAQVARNRRNRHIGDGGVQHIHKGGQRQRHRARTRFFAASTADGTPGRS